YTNRLAKETSPYLLMHAHNPVDWYPWGPEAFEKAKKEGKLVFLSIGYSSCYWCHVMERESFANEEVAKILNKWFVAIKVDLEEHAEEVAAATAKALAADRGIALVKLDRKLVAEAVEDVTESYDKEYGGFGSPKKKFKGPRFPMPSHLELLWHEGVRTKSADV